MSAAPSLAVSVVSAGLALTLLSQLLYKLLRALDPVARPAKFDSENANLAQTIAYNLGFGPEGFSARTKVLAKRTTVVVLSSFFNTFARVFVTIEGSEFVGALGWSGLWATAGLLTGIAYGWVAEE